MSRSKHSRKPKKRQFYGCGRTCPVCNPDYLLEFFRARRVVKEKEDVTERLAEVG